MEPILDRASGRGQAKSRGQIASVVLALLMSLVAVRAGTTNFMGDFGAAFWTNEVQFGTVGFSNSATELVLTGPNAPAAQQSSFDGIRYDGPLPGGLAVGGTVQFHWAYDSGDALSTSEADFAWTPPGGGGSTQNLLASGGPGVLASGDFTTPSLVAGTTFEFLLGTDTPAHKVSGSLVITSFEFHPDIPEPTTGTLVGGMLISLGAARWQRGRRSAASRP